MCFFMRVLNFADLHPYSTHRGSFFPGLRSETIVLRVFDSASDQVLPQAQITKGQGLLGQLMKKDVGRFFEGDLENSRVLFYYKDIVDVHSIIAVPLFLQGHFNGAIVVDSLEAGAFGPDQVEEIKSFANILGMLSFKYYVGFEHLYQKEQFSGLLDYQKKFLQETNPQAIFNHLTDFIESNLNFERLLILEKAEEGDNNGSRCGF